MKKIVHIVESFGGGVYSYLSDLTSGLVDEYEVYILYGMREQTPQNIVEDFDSKVKLIKIKNFTRHLDLISDIKASLEIKKYLKEIKPNIIHLHSSKAGGIGRLIKFNKGQKVFYTPHGYSFLNGENGNLKSKLYLSAEKILGNKKALTIACSKGEYKQSQRVTRYSTFINNSIDVDFLSRFKTDDTNSVDTIFTIGRISEQKNPKLFNNIASQFPNKQFIWIGDGPLKSELTSSNITVTGWMSREEVLKEIQPYKYFVLTSKWEGLPISLLEAMYFSKICFVTNIIGNNDVVTNNSNGYIFNDAKDFEEKFNAQNILKQDPSSFIEDNFSKREMIRKYKKVYSNSEL